MTPGQIVKQRSVGAINKALKDYRGASYVEPPRQLITSGGYEQLSRLQSDQGVIALVHACNLSGGSVGNMNLYKLIRTYLRDAQARSEINAVVGRYVV